MLNCSYEPANLHDSRVYEKARQEARNDDIQSPTLQNAITLATSNLTFVEYNLQCYKILIKELSDLPKCFYRSNIFHLLQTLNQWKCFNGFDNDIIHFYIRCIGFMSQLDSIVEFRKVTQTLRTYNLPETETREKLINSPSITYYNNEEPIGECKNALSSYINDIVVEAKSLCLSHEKVTDKPNFYHCEKFYLMFQSLCEKFPS
ncbi:hypothetical protein TSAR_010558 [Trichomalopsis sarcophagae]|uniref:Uncharacterized protein n=1 Tax=Trichomalopsis sarcophagae TaxID=543379 RepID=A0A232EKU3_9HYME|nr:hypothetical protein TSAR_010558 [Trichomalopsis sarcophagae]